MAESPAKTIAVVPVNILNIRQLKNSPLFTQSLLLPKLAGADY
jgi:hypothetical protein